MNIKNIFVLFFIGLHLCISSDYPSVKGIYRMTPEWSIELPTEFKRRFEAGDLVIWKPGITIWINAWGNKKGESINERVRRFKYENSKEKRSLRIEGEAGHALYTYEFKVRDETREIKDYFAVYAFKVNDSSYVQIWAYADSNKDKTMVYNIIRSINYETKTLTSQEVLNMEHSQLRNNVPPYLRRVQPNHPNMRR
jgi:hypothetical protein